MTYIISSRFLLTDEPLTVEQLWNRRECLSRGRAAMCQSSLFTSVWSRNSTSSRLPSHPTIHHRAIFTSLFSSPSSPSLRSISNSYGFCSRSSTLPPTSVVIRLALLHSGTSPTSSLNSISSISDDSRLMQWWTRALPYRQWNCRLYQRSLLDHLFHWLHRS